MNRTTLTPPPPNPSVGRSVLEETPEFYILFCVSICLAATGSLNDYEGRVTDDSQVLPAFCQSLESLLRQGLKGKSVKT